MCRVCKMEGGKKAVGKRTTEAARLKKKTHRMKSSRQRLQRKEPAPLIKEDGSLDTKRQEGPSESKV